MRSMAARLALKRRGEIEAPEMTGATTEPPLAALPAPLVGGVDVPFVAGAAVPPVGVDDVPFVGGAAVPPVGIVEPGGAGASVNAVTWSPLPTNSRPPPALGLAKWFTWDPDSGTA